MTVRSLENKRKSVYLFLLVFVIYALIYMTKNCYSAAMASIVTQGIMTKSETGLIAAAFYLFYSPFQIVGGIAADHFSPYKLILFGMFGAGVCNLLIYFLSGSYIAMIIIWSINAIVQFGIWPAIFKIVASQLHETHRKNGVLYISLASTTGLAVSYVCAAIITDWRMNFLLSAVILFLGVAAFGILYHLLSMHMTVNTVEQPKISKKSKKDKGILPLIIASGVPILMLVYTICGFLNLGVKNLSPVMLVETYSGLSSSLANALNIILVLAAPVGLLLSRLPIFKKMSEALVITLMFGLCVPLLLVVTFVGDVPLALIIAALTLLMVAVSLMSVYFSYISKAFEKYGYGATLAGLFNCMASFGIVLANSVFARIADSYGWGVTTKAWFITVIVSLLLTAITIPMWSRFKEKSKIED